MALTPSHPASTLGRLGYPSHQRNPVLSGSGHIITRRPKELSDWSAAKLGVFRGCEEKRCRKKRKVADAGQQLTHTAL